MMAGTSNQERADRGMRAVYWDDPDPARHIEDEHEEDVRAALTDCLADLMHFARRYDVDWDFALRMAEEHHKHEASYGWQELSL